MSETNSAVKGKRKPAKRINRVPVIDEPTPSVEQIAASYQVSLPPLPEIGSAFANQDTIATGSGRIKLDLGTEVYIEPRKATKKIAIVGKAPSTIEQAPYADQDWEIWGLSDLILHPKCTRWSRWFELHDPEGWHPDDSCPRRQKWHKEYWKFLTSDHGGKPIYVREPHHEIKSGVLFPYQKLIERYCIRDKNDKALPYFTNTVSWMIAMALDEGATHISVFGVDMAQQEKGVKSEYAYQRPSVEYFIGVAHGMGVKVFIPDNADLMKAVRLYAIDSLSANARSAHRKRLNDLQNMRKQNDQELAQLEKQLREKQERRLVLIGAEDDTRQWWGQQVL